MTGQWEIGKESGSQSGGFSLWAGDRGILEQAGRGGRGEKWVEMFRKGNWWTVCKKGRLYVRILQIHLTSPFLAHA